MTLLGVDEEVLVVVEDVDVLLEVVVEEGDDVDVLLVVGGVVVVVELGVSTKYAAAPAIIKITTITTTTATVETDLSFRRSVLRMPSARVARRI